MGTLRDIREESAKVFSLPPDDLPAVDYIISLIISNVWTDDADPLWGWLIGPPGSCKTELVRPLQTYEHIHYLSSLTSCALVSGYDPDGEQSDVSLLPQLKNKVLVIKDFTAILGQPEASLAQIFADLRDAYDGSYAKHFGTVGNRSYKAKFGLLAAVTPAIDAITSSQVVLGERFLSFRICRSKLGTPERIRYLKHVRMAMSNKDKWRQHLAYIWQSSLDDIIANLPSRVEIPSHIDDAIIHTADLVSRLRCLPALDHLRSAEDTGETDAEPEMGSRLVNQFTNLALAHAAADERQAVDSSDLSLVQRVAVDTLPPMASNLLRTMSAASDFLNVRQITKLSGIPTKGIKPLLYMYENMGLVEPSQEGSSYNSTRNDMLWRLTDETREQLSTSGVLAPSE